MGQFLSLAWERLFEKRRISLLMLGLDRSGKTTILYRLASGDVTDPRTIRPTVGFNVETSIECGPLAITLWDVGGQKHLRPLWTHHDYANMQGLIFVVDSTDRVRIDQTQDSEQAIVDTSARSELARMMNEEEYGESPLLVYANKQDQPSAMTIEEVTERLRLHRLPHTRWHVQGCSAVTGDGLCEGLDWLTSTIVETK